MKRSTEIIKVTISEKNHFGELENEQTISFLKFRTRKYNSLRLRLIEKETKTNLSKDKIKTALRIVESITGGFGK